MCLRLWIPGKNVANVSCTERLFYFIWSQYISHRYKCCCLIFLFFFFFIDSQRSDTPHQVGHSWPFICLVFVFGTSWTLLRAFWQIVHDKKLKVVKLSKEFKMAQTEGCSNFMSFHLSISIREYILTTWASGMKKMINIINDVNGKQS